MAEDLEFGLTAPDNYGQLRKTAGPWPRFWSRSFDIVFWAFPLGYIVAFVFPSIALRFTMMDSQGYLFGIALFPLVMLVDALSLSLLGNTLGRAIAGIRVETIRHERISVITAIKRNGLVYLKGLGLGIPIVALFTEISNYKKVTAGGQTSWDEYLYTRVYDVSSNIYRTIVCAVLVIFANATPKIVDEINRQQQTANGNPDASSVTDPVEQQLREAAARLKPQMVDQLTRLDSADVVGRTFTYHYSIIRRNTSDEQFGEFFNKTIRPKVCVDGNFRPLLRDYQIIYRYSYMMPNANNPLVYQVKWEDCQH